jgi:hypothetical protein
MSDDNVIEFPKSEEVKDAEEQSDLFFVMAVYFDQNFKKLFEEHDSKLPEYIALLTLTEIVMYHIQEGYAYIKDDDGMLQLAMAEGLHEEIIEGMKELSILDERTENDIH